MQRITDFSKGLVGLALTIAIIAGLPAVLVQLVGVPLPTRWPGFDIVRQHIVDGRIPDAFIIKLIALAVWLAWSQILVATIGEYVAMVRGKAATRSPALPALRTFASKLAAWTTLLVAGVSPVRPVVAAPLVPLAAAIAEPESVLVPVAATTGPTDSRSHPTARLGRYTTVRGDTWWDISERLFGTGLRWNEVRSLNIDTRMPDGHIITSSTDIVEAGWPLLVPADSATDEAATVASDEQTVVVEQGDHFWSIAEANLTEAWGRAPTDTEIAPYWLELMAANDDRLLPPEDPNLIYPGQTFVLPEAPRSPDLAPDLNGDHVLDATPADVSESPFGSEETTDTFDGTTAPLNSPPTTRDPVAEAVSDSAPSPTTTADAPAEPALADPDPDPTDESSERGVPVGAVAGGSALLAALITTGLRHRRRIQAARRTPQTVLVQPDSEAAELEDRIRAISTDGEDVRYLTAVNSYLSHQLENATTPIPSIVAAMAGRFGVELLLDDPCQPVDGFSSTNDEGTAWRLRADIDISTMESECSGDAHPFAPALTAVGSTDAGSVLLDLEQLGVLALEGSPASCDNLARGMIAALGVAPWAERCEIVAIGIEGLSEQLGGRVRVPEDPNTWADRAATNMRAVADSLARSPYEERVAHGVIHHPTIVFVGSDESLQPIASQLVEAAELAYAPLAVVTAQNVASEYRVELEDGAGVLEPFGLQFSPVAVEPAEAEAIQRLLVAAAPQPTEATVEMPAGELAFEGPLDLGDLATLLPSESNPFESALPAHREVADPSADALAAIEEIMRPRPVEVAILGRQPVIEGLEGDPAPKSKAIIAFIACHGEVAGQRLRDEFWPGSDRRQACDNAMVKVRALVGMDSDGQPRIETDRNSGSYRAGAEIGVDWHRAQQLLDAAKEKPSADEAAYLDAAVVLIEGKLAIDVGSDLYGWLLNDPTTYTAIETALIDAAHRRAQLALAAGDHARAIWAADQGLKIVDGQEALYRIKMQAAAAAGDTDAVNAAYREAQRAAESYGFDGDVQSETRALYESLTAPARVWPSSG